MKIMSKNKQTCFSRLKINKLFLKKLENEKEFQNLIKFLLVLEKIYYY